jgi:hypothetical protein
MQRKGQDPLPFLFCYGDRGIKNIVFFTISVSTFTCCNDAFQNFTKLARSRTEVGHVDTVGDFGERKEEDHQVLFAVEDARGFRKWARKK